MKISEVELIALALPFREPLPDRARRARPPRDAATPDPHRRGSRRDRRGGAAGAARRRRARRDGAQAAPLRLPGSRAPSLAPVEEQPLIGAAELLVWSTVMLAAAAAAGRGGARGRALRPRRPDRGQQLAFFFFFAYLLAQLRIAAAARAALRAEIAELVLPLAHPVAGIGAAKRRRERIEQDRRGKLPAAVGARRRNVLEDLEQIARCRRRPPCLAPAIAAAAAATGYGSAARARSSGLGSPARSWACGFRHTQRW